MDFNTLLMALEWQLIGARTTNLVQVVSVLETAAFHVGRAPWTVKPSVLARRRVERRVGVVPGDVDPVESSNPFGVKSPPPEVSFDSGETATDDADRRVGQPKGAPLRTRNGDILTIPKDVAVVGNPQAREEKSYSIETILKELQAIQNTGCVVG